MTNRECFVAVCVLMYGHDYTSPVSKLLGVRRDSVQQWSSGRQEVPSSVFDELELHARTRARDFGHAVGALERRKVNQ